MLAARKANIFRLLSSLSDSITISATSSVYGYSYQQSPIDKLSLIGKRMSCLRCYTLLVFGKHGRKLLMAYVQNLPLHMSYHLTRAKVC